MWLFVNSSANVYYQPSVFICMGVIGLGCGVVPRCVGYTGQEGMASSCARGEFRLDISKHFFTEKVFKHWNRLPREAVGSPSKSGSAQKARDNSQQTMVWFS